MKSNFLVDNGKCGCGKDGRYINIQTGTASCNKSSRCPTYNELEDMLEKSGDRLLSARKELNEIKSAIKKIKSILDE